MWNCDGWSGMPNHRGRRGRGRSRGYYGAGRYSQNPRVNKNTTSSEIIEPNKVFIANINRNVSNETLKTHLNQFAPVVSLNVIRKRGHFPITPFGFVELANAEDTQKILNLERAYCFLEGSCMTFKPAKMQFKLPGTFGFQRSQLVDRDFDMNPPNSEDVCIHVLIDDVLLRIFEYLPLKNLISSERVCRRWQSLIHTCFRKKACQEIKGDLNAWLIKNKVIPTYQSISKTLILCGETMTDLSVGDVSSQTEGKLLRIIAQLCPSLESLTLSNVAAIHNNFLQELVTSCKTLKKFHIKEESAFNEANLLTLVSSLPHLEVLHLEGADIRGKCLGSLPTTLKVLNLSHCNFIQPTSISHIALRCPVLEVLRLDGVCIPSSLLTEISTLCPNLCELGIEINGTNSKVDMAAFKNLKKLTYCGILYSVNSLISSLPQLEELTLDGLISESAQHIIDFSTLSELRTLVLPWNNKVTINPNSLKTVASCTKLEKLKFKGNSEHKSIILELIRRCQCLKELDCPTITLGGTDIESFVEANRRRPHRLKFVIGLDKNALDQIEKLNEANYDVDMFDVHNLFSDFDVDILNELGADLGDGDYYYDSEGSLDSDEANLLYFNDDFWEYGRDYLRYVDPLGLVIAQDDWSEEDYNDFFDIS